MATSQPTDTPDTDLTALVPPPPAHEGEPQVTVEDPSADGYYCAAKRSPRQIRAAIESGDPNPWPWCRMRAGRGTDHAGVGSCSFHAGNTPNGRRSARLRLDELVGPAIATIARLITDPEAPDSVRLRAAQDALDRAGYPRRLEVDVEEARESLYDRLLSARLTSEGDEN